MAEKELVTRREFLGGSGSTLLGASLLAAGGCATKPAAKAVAMAHPRVIGANDRIRLGVIGVGMRGPELIRELKQIEKDGKLNAEIGGVCEIYERRKQIAMGLSGLKSCHHNYEELITDPNIDALVIAVPDHWHMPISIDAMRGGKDVYCEKPMTHTWEEAKKVVGVQKETGRVFQVGAQSASEEKWWKAREVIGDGKSGLLGKLLEFHTGYNRNVPGGDWNYKIFDDANEQTVDWTRWLGNAPKRPWSPERFFRFRKYWDYSGGLATDLLYHQLSHIAVALNFPFPTRVTGTGGTYVHGSDGREVPDTFTIAADFENSCSGMLFSTAGNNTVMEEMIRGEHATLTAPERGDTLVIRPQEPFRKEFEEQARTIQGLEIIEKKEGGKTGIEEVRLTVPTPSKQAHMENFIQCMRSRELTHLNAEAGYRVMMTIALGVKAFREDRVCRFDPVSQKLL